MPYAQPEIKLPDGQYMAFFSEQLIDVKNILWYHPVFPIMYDSA